MSLDNLDLDLTEVDLGPAIVTCTIEGIVDEDDLQELAAGGSRETVDRATGEVLPAAKTPEPLDDPTDLKKIRERHHAVARMLASGMTQSLVASISGFTPGYLSVLINNPSMQELLESYRIQQGAAAQVIGEKLRTVGLKAVEKLDGRLDADELNNQDLLGLAKLGLDRSGHGPSSTTHNVSEQHVIDHAKIAELNKRALEGSREYIVPMEAVRKSLPSPDGEPEV